MSCLVQRAQNQEVHLAGCGDSGLQSQKTQDAETQGSDQHKPEPSLGFTISFRTAWATEQDCVSNQKEAK